MPNGRGAAPPPPAAAADDLDYAPLFGNPELTFHTKIPGVRRPWEDKTYKLAELENLNAGLEDLDWDPPLSRWRKKAVYPIKSIMACLGLHWLYDWHEKRYRQDR